ncbi:MAG: type II toxin-antitoxin system YafQ family toxin [Prevotella sp.]|nr:type II toxin-antitoxin system YafQ family toxin [Prevotella sp.]
MYKLQLSGRFKKSYKKCIKRGYDKFLFEEVVSILSRGEPLPAKYMNHPLHGNYEGWNDCHILPDWVLVWKYDNDELILCLLDTGTHSDLFKK